MGSKKIYIILAFEIVLCTALAIISYYAMHLEDSFYIIYLPVEAAGSVLRWMSLSSASGNVIAWICYVLISITPLLLMILIRRKRSLNPIDICLPIISIFTFYILHRFTNPFLMLGLVSEPLRKAEFLSSIKIILPMMYYSLIITYTILLTVRNTNQKFANATANHQQALFRSINTIISTILIIMTASVFCFSLFDVFQKMAKAGGLGNIQLDILFIWIKYFFDSLPSALLVIILLAVRSLFITINADSYSQSVLQKLKRITDLSKATVIISLLCTLFVNFLQLIMSDILADVHFVLNVPLFPLLAALIAMILSKYQAERVELYIDNNMII